MKTLGLAVATGLPAQQHGSPPTLFENMRFLSLIFLTSITSFLDHFNLITANTADYTTNMPTANHSERINHLFLPVCYS
jgi:hypothetical protein